MTMLHRLGVESDWRSFVRNVRDCVGIEIEYWGWLTIGNHREQANTTIALLKGRMTVFMAPVCLSIREPSKFTHQSCCCRSRNCVDRVRVVFFPLVTVVEIPANITRRWRDSRLFNRGLIEYQRISLRLSRGSQKRVSAIYRYPRSNPNGRIPEGQDVLVASDIFRNNLRSDLAARVLGSKAGHK